MSGILSFISWWLIVTSAGLLVWPLMFRMLPRLPERGYALSKTCGLLLVGYTFWMLSSLGYLRLTPGGVILSAILVAVSAMRWGKSGEALKWVREHRYWVLACEGVFLVGFGIWAYIRALNPEIVGTEKPMEFAFLNSILRGGVMPPRDPWLSGYAISYYYFGYVIIAMLTRLSGVVPSVAFNLGVALVFGLAVVGSFGVAFNVMAVSVRSAGRDLVSLRGVSRFAFPALLAPVFAVITGNLNGILEVLHQRGLIYARFWEWLGVKWLDAVPTAGEAWMPQRYLWWWQASRVIRDRDLTGAPIDLQPIAEFPFFSFLLGDLHPHVLALPFVFLALAVALEIFITAGARSGMLRQGWMAFPSSQMLFIGLVLGGLAFLNMWDFPVYLLVAVAAYVVGRREVGSHGLRFGVVMAGFSGLLYLPFYLGFRSQAGGILPNPVFATQLNQFTVLFGVLLVPVLGWLFWEAGRARRVLNWRLGVITGPGVLTGMVILCGALTTFILLTPEFSGFISTNSFATVSKEDAARMIVRRRFLEHPSTSIMLTGALMLAGGILPRKTTPRQMDGAAVPFVAVLIGVGALLTLVPEFLYLQDSFGSRMNTVFKFYYQAWAVWSIVATYGCWRVWQESARWYRFVFGAAVAFTLGAGLVYTMLSMWTKTVGFMGTTVIGGERVADLDGMAWMAQSEADEHQAILWLNNFLAEDGNIAEAVGSSYSNYARVSSHSGIPTVLGWPGHELQWRGDFDVAAGREQAVGTMYSVRAWDEAAAVISEYDIRYVYVGPLERQLFPADGLEKFDDYMHVVYRNAGVTIYERLD